MGTYNRTFTFLSTVLVELAEAHFERAEWVASFGKDTTKEEALGGVSDNGTLGTLKALFRKLLSNTCSARKKTARDVFIHLCVYQNLVSGFFAAI